MTIGKRLKAERERIGLNQTAFGAIGGVKKQAQLKYENDSSSPTANYLAEIAKIGVDIQYVIIGQRSNQAVSPEESLLLETFRLSSPDVRNYMLRGAQKVDQQIHAGDNASIVYNKR